MSADGGGSESQGMRIEIMNPCNDYAFKLAFEDPEILVPFLNTILEFKTPESQIVHVTILNPSLTSPSPLGRQYISDLLCATRNGQYILLEMQNDSDEFCADKALLELCRLTAKSDAYKLAVEQGTDILFSDLSRREEAKTRQACGMKNFWKGFAVIVISNKKIPPGRMKVRRPTEPIMEPKVRNTYQMMTVDGTQVRHLGNADFKVIVVMLANFTKKVNELVDDEDRWFYALKDENLSSGKSKMERFRVIDPLEQAIADNDGVRRFYQKLNKTNFENVGSYISRVEKDEQHDEALRAEGEAEGKSEILDMIVRANLKRQRESEESAQDTSILQTLHGVYKEDEIRKAICRIRAE